MPKVVSAWGIDIGQCALKALHCTATGDEVVADAFDFIEYPKILSQPEAEPEQLVREAIETFLSRNEINRREDQVVISVPGQSGLAKFFKPPPVDVKKIPDIVQYEAKQQIPFPLEEVVWDFQKLAGGQVIDGFAIDAEVGLFAMKRDQVYRALKPFTDADIQVSAIQLAPISLYNFVAHDILTDGPDEEWYDPDDPPESVVLLSMGTDATDLVVTNGFRVWQRSIPLGGSHFTKQLTKELKLTFAKAEHLKRNARQAEDPKAIFQAMRPIFNDMVTEVQRSIGYFQGIDRTAKIKGVVLMGNTVKLPGLQQYIAKNLGYDVIEFESFNLLSGQSVLSSPQFNENTLAYGVSYGLCLQGLKKARLGTSLLPREIITRRIVKAKKPWAVASAGALILACSFNFFFHYNVWSTVKKDYEYDSVKWDQAEKKLDTAKSTSANHKSRQKDLAEELDLFKSIGQEVVGADERRLYWAELLLAMNQALPRPEGVPPGEYVSVKDLPLDKRPNLYIDYVESEYFPDLKSWYNDNHVKRQEFQLNKHLNEQREKEGRPAPIAVEPEPVPEKDPGWVIELSGYHYYYPDRLQGGANHLRNTFMQNLREGMVQLPVEHGSRIESFTMKEFGISNPIISHDTVPTTKAVPNPDYDPSGASSEPSKAGEDSGPDLTKVAEFQLTRYDFTVQFAWRERTLDERVAVREKRLEAEKKAAEAAAAAAAEAAENQEGAEGSPPDNAPPADAPPAAAPADAAAPVDNGAAAAPAANVQEGN